MAAGGSRVAARDCLARDQLEDRFFQLKDQHLILKKQATDAGQQVKCLNTKLMRLINEKKRLVDREKTKREVDLEELNYDLQDKIGSMESENHRLQNRILVLKTQLDTELNKKRVSSAYAHVQAKTDSGLVKSRSRLASGSWLGSRSTVVSRPTSGWFNLKRASSVDFTYKLLEEAHEEMKKLEDIVALQQLHIESLSSGQTEDRELKRTSSSSANGPLVITSKSNNKIIPHKVSSQEASDLKSDGEIANLLKKLQQDLELERSNCANLRKKLLECSIDHKSLEELNQQIRELEKENEILRNSLEQCIGSCLSEINESSKKSDEKSKKQEDRIRSKMASLKKENSHLKRELTEEKTKYNKLMMEHEQLKIRHEEATRRMEEIEKRREEAAVEGSDRFCNRSDHIDLKQQLDEMQSEREKLLNEFEEMKRLLQMVQDTIIEGSE